MKVHELIAKLRAFPQDVDVLFDMGEAADNAGFPSFVDISGAEEFDGLATTNAVFLSSDDPALRDPDDPNLPSEAPGLVAFRETLRRQGEG